MDILGGITLTLTLSDRRKTPRTEAREKPLNGHKKPTSLAPITAKSTPSAEGAAATPATTRFNPAEWTPLDRLLYVGIQQCPACAKRTEFIAGDLIRYSQPSLCGGQRTIRTRAFGASDHRFLALTQKVEYLPPEQHTCPSCVAASDAITAVLEHSRAVQIPLFL